jgi:hypothetical protein
MPDQRLPRGRDIRFLNVWSACLPGAAESKSSEDLLSRDARQFVYGVVVCADQPRSEAKVVIRCG